MFWTLLRYTVYLIPDGNRTLHDSRGVQLTFQVSLSWRYYPQSTLWNSPLYLAVSLLQIPPMVLVSQCGLRFPFSEIPYLLLQTSDNILWAEAVFQLVVYFRFLSRARRFLCFMLRRNVMPPNSGRWTGLDKRWHLQHSPGSFYLHLRWRQYVPPKRRTKDHYFIYKHKDHKVKLNETKLHTLKYHLQCKFS